LATYGGSTDQVLVATKGGHRRPGDGSWTIHGDPAYIKEACDASLKALGVEAIGLYQYHRPDPKVPYGDSVGALADLLDAGKILMAGISNATVAQIDEAQEVLNGRLVSVQNEFSPRFRSSENELDHCEKIGVAFIPWSPMGGIGRSGHIEADHPAFNEVAAEVGATPQQVTLAWMLAKGSRVIPIPGSSRPATATASAAAADLVLSPEQVTRLNAS
jgi:aryl-alcohol dehydrogenase-like predicted oxidoreductase